MWTADDDFDDWEYPDDSIDDAADTLPCPECGTAVYEDAEQCHACGHYITQETNPLRGRSFAWLALGLLGTAAVIAALLLG